LKSQVRRVGHVLGPHVGAELPRDAVTAVIIQDGRQIKPTPAQNFEVPLSPTNVLESLKAMEQPEPTDILLIALNEALGRPATECDIESFKDRAREDILKLQKPATSNSTAKWRKYLTDRGIIR
jgi:hypothetical protein